MDRLARRLRSAPHCQRRTDSSGVGHLKRRGHRCSDSRGDGNSQQCGRTGRHRCAEQRDAGEGGNLLGERQREVKHQGDLVLVEMIDRRSSQIPDGSGFEKGKVAGDAVNADWVNKAEPFEPIQIKRRTLDLVSPPLLIVSVSPQELRRQWSWRQSLDFGIARDITPIRDDAAQIRRRRRHIELRHRRAHRIARR